MHENRHINKYENVCVSAGVSVCTCARHCTCVCLCTCAFVCVGRGILRVFKMRSQINQKKIIYLVILSFILHNFDFWNFTLLQSVYRVLAFHLVIHYIVYHVFDICFAHIICGKYEFYYSNWREEASHSYDDNKLYSKFSFWCMYDLNMYVTASESFFLIWSHHLIYYGLNLISIY